MHRALQKVLDCFFLLRFPLLAPVWTILLLGWIAGSEMASPGGVFLASEAGHPSYVLLWFSLLAFSLIVSSIYVTNQIADIESDRLNQKLFFLPREIISVRTAWIPTFFCAASGLVLGFLIDVWMGALMVASLGLGYFYNLPPARLKDRAWGGTIANSLGHGVLTFLVGWYSSKLGSPIDKTLLIKGITASLSLGFANAAVYITTTIPDERGDRETGKRTFCVVYGPRVTAITATIGCFLALLLSVKFEYNYWVMAAPSAVSLVLFAYLMFSPERNNAFRAFKWPVFLLTVSVAVFMPLYAILIAITFWGSRLYYRWRFDIEYPTFKAQ